MYFIFQVFHWLHLSNQMFESTSSFKFPFFILSHFFSSLYNKQNLKLIQVNDSIMILPCILYLALTIINIKAIFLNCDPPQVLPHPSTAVLIWSKSHQSYNFIHKYFPMYLWKIRTILVHCLSFPETFIFLLVWPFSFLCVDFPQVVGVSWLSIRI